MKVYIPCTFQTFIHKYCFSWRNKNIENCSKIKNGKVKCYKGYKSVTHVPIHKNMFGRYRLFTMVLLKMQVFCMLYHKSWHGVNIPTDLNLQNTFNFTTTTTRSSISSVIMSNYCTNQRHKHLVDTLYKLWYDLAKQVTTSTGADEWVVV